MQQKIELLAIGSDIEFALLDKKTKEFVSAEGLIQGTKEEPFKFDPNNEHYATSLDNVLYEGNIPPATSSYEFYMYVRRLQKYMQSQLPENLKLVSVAAPKYNVEKYLSTLNAKTAGCAASINAWTAAYEHPQIGDTPYRGAGLHLHVSYKNAEPFLSLDLIKAMDLYLGVPAVLIEPENARKTTGYGKAGNCRLGKSYPGVEYRSLSGYFSKNKKLLEWCFNNTKHAIDFINSGKIELIQNL